MKELLLATNSNTWTSYVLIAVVVLLLISMPVMMNARNKKETQKIKEQTNSLKVGDKVLTTSGVYGTITELKFSDSQMIVVIETGGKTKSYLSVDAYAIYTVFKSNEEIARDTQLAEEKKIEEKTEKTEDVTQEKVEKPAKKTKTKKTEEKK